MIAQAKGTPAGSEIVNVATATFVDGEGRNGTVTSNPSVLKVGEVLDVVVSVRDPGRVPVSSPAAEGVLAFSVTNTGNGREAFALSSVAGLSGDQFKPTVQRLALDSDGDGRFDPARDALYTAGAEPVLDPDQSTTVFLVSDIPGDLRDGDLGSASLTATALTGSGAPGRTLDGRGDGGGDAVVGASGARSVKPHGYAAALAEVRLVKSQSLTHPSGGDGAISGAVITYTLAARVEGRSRIDAGRITDAIPPTTTFVPGSLRLDGVTLTDAADDDAGAVGAEGVSFLVGALAASSTRTASFQVRIN
jgi:uncharacterized repeat protein (TIGR01451 family)